MDQCEDQPGKIIRLYSRYSCVITVPNKTSKYVIREPIVEFTPCKGFRISLMSDPRKFCLITRPIIVVISPHVFLSMIICQRLETVSPQLNCHRWDNEGNTRLMTSRCSFVVLNLFLLSLYFTDFLKVNWTLRGIIIILRTGRVFCTDKSTTQIEVTWFFWNLV